MNYTGNGSSLASGCICIGIVFTCRIAGFYCTLHFRFCKKYLYCEYVAKRIPKGSLKCLILLKERLNRQHLLSLLLYK